jgi:hypothetical protein
MSHNWLNSRIVLLITPRRGLHRKQISQKLYCCVTQLTHEPSREHCFSVCLCMVAIWCLATDVVCRIILGNGSMCCNILNKLALKPRMKHRETSDSVSLLKTSLQPLLCQGIRQPIFVYIHWNERDGQQYGWPETGWDQTGVCVASGSKPFQGTICKRNTHKPSEPYMGKFW